MKSFAFFSLFLALFFVSTTTTFAQDKAADLTEEQKEQMAKNMEEFITSLNLTEEQKPEFEAITKKYAGQMQEVKEEGGSKMSKYKKVKSIKKNRNAEMEKLLTAEQYEIYLVKQKEMQDKMKEQKNSKG